MTGHVISLPFGLGNGVKAAEEEHYLLNDLIATLLEQLLDLPGSAEIKLLKM